MGAPPSVTKRWRAQYNCRCRLSTHTRQKVSAARACSWRQWTVCGFTASLPLAYTCWMDTRALIGIIARGNATLMRAIQNGQPPTEAALATSGLENHANPGANVEFAHDVSQDRNDSLMQSAQSHEIRGHGVATGNDYYDSNDDTSGINLGRDNRDVSDHPAQRRWMILRIAFVRRRQEIPPRRDSRLLKRRRRRHRLRTASSALAV
nr:hypothetical protein [Pandoravirus massiliensis]